MKISAFKRIIKEDFDEKDQPLIEKLATIFNLFQEQIYQAFNNNITISENLSALTTTFKVKVSSTGVPLANGQIKYTLKSRPKGCMVINSRSLEGVLLVGAPFITFDISGDILNITQITGLAPNKEYELTVVFFGS